MKNYEDISTDELLEMLPNKLHLTKNDNAAPVHKWCMFNMDTFEFDGNCAPTARELMIQTYSEIDVNS